MDEPTKKAPRMLKSLRDENVLSEVEFKTEKNKLLGNEGHIYNLCPSVILELRELKSFFQDDILDREEFVAQKRSCLDKTIQAPASQNIRQIPYSAEVVTGAILPRPQM